MRRWFALAVLGLGVSWGPYLYGFGARPHTTDVSPLTAADDADEAAVDPVPTPAPSPAVRLPLMAAKAAAVAPTPKLASIATMIPTAPPPSAAIEPVIGSDAKPIANPSADLLPAFRHAFDQEPRDSFWASEEEPHLSQLMQAAGLPDGSVSEVSCRRSVCRVSFNKAEFGSEVESKLLTSLHQEFGTSVSIEPASLGHDEHAPLYVLRSGYSLESAP